MVVRQDLWSALVVQEVGEVVVDGSVEEKVGTDFDVVVRTDSSVWMMVVVERYPERVSTRL